MGFTLPEGWSLKPPTPKASSSLFNRLIQQESGGDPTAVSPKGAQGLTQLMPATMADPGFGIKPFDFSTANPVSENKRMGKDYLDAMLKRYNGDEEAALAAYNWGPGNADKWVSGGKDPNQLPAETRTYIKNILGGQTPQPQQTAGGFTLPEGWSTEPPKQGGVTEVAKGNAPVQIAGGNNPVQPGELQQPFDYAQASMGDIAAKAGENLVPSAKQFGQDILGIVTNPVETGKNMARLTAGAIEKLIPGRQSHEQVAEAVGQFFVDRYGGVENLKRTMATDPVGFAADAATLLSGGELALARAPGIVGEVGRAIGTASRAIDPITGAVRGVTKAAKGAGRVGASIVGTTTGTGGTPIREAARAGFEGGARGAAFREQMRGTAPIESVVEDAKTGLAAIRQERQAAYRAGMADVSKDATVLDFGKIEKSLADTKTQFTFKGISKNPRAAAALQKVATILDDWKKLDPKEFHTAEGFDALKQQIGAELESIPFEQKGARQAVSQVYNTVKRQIERQAPTYAKTMRNYQQASDLIKEIEKTLSLNPRANVDTALRKLQSTMRNNVNTNYGKRADLAKLLQEHGAEHLLAKLAGQSLNQWSARGLARIAQGMQAAGAVGGAGYGLMGLLNPAVLLPMIPTMAAQSPRIVGEAVHAGGRVAGAGSNIPLSKVLMGAYQTRGARQ